jgi:hypothetical protein
MTPLYEVWQSHQPEGYTWSSCWQDYERVLLPIAWAKAYASELTERSGFPTEVRGKKHKVKAQFGVAQ